MCAGQDVRKSRKQILTFGLTKDLIITGKERGLRTDHGDIRKIEKVKGKVYLALNCTTP